jgi:putative oxidoreductase
MKLASTISRYFLGLIFFVFGLNGFLNFIPVPTDLPEHVIAFMTALNATGYFFPLLKATEVTCGALLLANRFAPLALVILAPIVVQITAYHLFMTPEISQLIMPVALIIAGVLAAMGYKDRYAPLLKP